MNIRQLIANKLYPTEKNTMGQELAQDFLRYGPRVAELPDWSQTLMADQDRYTGYMYGAITRRASKVAWLATYNLRTKANDPILKAAKDKETDVAHPYLDIIDNSPTFANDAFWRDIQTFIDLKGVYYLMVVRGRVGDKLGEVKEFKLLNPYEITPVYDSTDMNIIGYTEVQGAMFREISPHMVIPIKPLNPFDRKKPWSLADAAQEAQFTLKETAQQMRTTARRNRKYPGVVLLGGSGVALNPEQVTNFKSRLRGKATGGQGDEPMFATAETVSGGISWNDMQVDIRKSAVDLVNEIQLNGLIAVTGVSKTKFGIEQSGVTRDTAAIQDDLFVLDHAMTALQLIIDALNQDYKTNYPDEYKENGYFLYIDSPLKEDKTAALTDVTNRTNTFDLYTTLLNKGYDSATAADYASGNKDLSDIGEPTNPPKVTPPVTPPVDPVTKDPVLEKPISAKASLVLNQLAARDVPGLYDGTGVDPEDLGCIMLDTEPLDITSLVKDGEADLVSETDRHEHQMGAVAEMEPHITLLYGLLENGNIWKDKVDAVLDGWKMDKATIEKVDYFETPDSYAVIAHIETTPELIDGHERLTLLPHIQTFSEYQPHMTLAYIQKTADVQKWVKALGDAYDGRSIKVTGINYGDLSDDSQGNNGADHKHEAWLPAIRNQLDPATQANVEQQAASLRNGVINVQHQVVTAVLNKVTTNALDNQGDIIDAAQRDEAEKALALALETFYTAVIPLNAATVMNRRTAEFSKFGAFAMDQEVKSYITVTATRAAESHIDTVLRDILDTIQATEERLVQGELKKITPEPGQSNDDVLALARKKALEGVGREQIAAAIRQEYNDTISKTRATTIARTETNRAYNRAQYEADREFLAQNELTGRAYKKWVTRSSNPCPFCLSKAAEAPIPFKEDFAQVGDVLKATFETSDGTPSVRQMQVGFEDVGAGNLHPNCQCTYQLIIE